MISRFVGSIPTSGSVLTSVEPAWDPLSPSLKKKKKDNKESKEVRKERDNSLEVKYFQQSDAKEDSSEWEVNNSCTPIFPS